MIATDGTVIAAHSAPGVRREETAAGNAARIAAGAATEMRTRRNPAGGILAGIGGTSVGHATLAESSASGGSAALAVHFAAPEIGRREEVDEKSALGMVAGRGRAGGIATEMVMVAEIHAESIPRNAVYHLSPVRKQNVQRMTPWAI